MTTDYLDSQGRLLGTFKPAVYLDASVLIDYWSVEGLEFEKDRDATTPSRQETYRDIVRQLVKEQKRLVTMIEIRKRVALGEPTVAFVTSALAVLELVEWYAETSFTQMAAEVMGASKVRRLGKKDAGKLLAKAIEISDREREEGKKVEFSSPIEQFMASTVPSPGYAEAHGLRGIIVADIIGFGLAGEEAWGPCAHLAYLQVGAADIAHVLFAHHLGCDYFATFDSDFERAREVLETTLSLRLLSSPKELLRAIS